MNLKTIFIVTLVTLDLIIGLVINRNQSTATAVDLTVAEEKYIAEKTAVLERV